MKLEKGTRIYYRGDMANREGFGEITEIYPANKYAGEQVKITMDDEREITIPKIMIKGEDTGNGMTRFCTEQAYMKRKKEQFERMKKEAEKIQKEKATL